MYDLIDRQAAIRMLRGEGVAKFPPNFVYGLVAASAELEKLPAVDAVEVVRCKDCKHMAVVRIGYRWCEEWERIQPMGDDGYCCFGERRGEDG